MNDPMNIKFKRPLDEPPSAFITINGTQLFEVAMGELFDFLKHDFLNCPGSGKLNDDGGMNKDKFYDDLFRYSLCESRNAILSSAPKEDHQFIFEKFDRRIWAKQAKCGIGGMDKEGQSEKDGK